MAEEVIAAVAIEAVVDVAVAEVATDVAIGAAFEVGADVAAAEVGTLVAGEVGGGFLTASGEIVGTLAAAEMAPTLAADAAAAVAEAGFADGEIVSVTETPAIFNVESGLNQPAQTFATVQLPDGEVVQVPFTPSEAPIEANIPGTTLPEGASSSPTSFGASDILRAGGVVTTAVGGVEQATTGGISDQLRSAGQAVGEAGSTLKAAKAAGALDFTTLTGLLGSVVNLVGNDTAVTAALGQILQQAVTPLLKDLGGTLGKIVVGVLPSLGVLSGSSVKILSALIEGKEIPTDSLLGVSREILLTTRRIAGPGAAGVLGPTLTLLSRTIPRYSRQREQLITELGIRDPATALTDEQRQTLLDRLFAGDTTTDIASDIQFGSIQLASGGAMMTPVLWVVRIVLSVFSIAVIPQIVNLFRETFPALAEQMTEWGGGAGKMIVGGMETLHLPMQQVLETSSHLLFESIEEKLSELGLITPENVLDAAPKILSIAGGLGMGAHLSASLAEQVHILKHLGFPQLAAFLVDMSQFSGIAKDTIGQRFNAALAAPSRRAALKQFRPELPDPRSLSQMLHWRTIAPDDVRAYYAEHGWRDDMIEAQLTSMWRTPTARELGYIFQDATVDEEWVLQALQRSGYNDADAEKVLGGVRARSTLTLRSSLVNAALDAFEKGYITTGELDLYLQPLDLRPEVRELWQRTAALRRYTKTIDGVVQAYTDAAANGQFTPDELRQELYLQGAGVEGSAQAQRLAKIRNGLRLFKKAQSELTAEERKARDTAIGNALALHRRGELDDSGLENALHQVGIIHEEIDALIDKAKIARVPIPQLPIALTPEAVLQQALFRNRDSILALQRSGLLDQLTTEATLIAIGIDPLEASSRTNLLASQLVHPPPAPKPPKPDPVKVAAEKSAAAAARATTRANAAELAREQKLHRTAAVTLFRGGLSTAQELYAQLVAFGYEAGEAAAIVDAEVARVVSKEQQAADKAAAHAEQQRERELAKVIADDGSATG